MKKEKSLIDYIIENGDRKYSIHDHIKWKIERISDTYRAMKWFFQRLFRSYHASDCDIWGLHSHLAPLLLAKLIIFRNSPLHGHPSCFSEYNENEWKSKKEYNEAVTKKEILGGGFEAWLKALDEMIFAFEFLTYYEANDKKRDKMLKKYGLKYPHEKIPENRKVHYVYRSDENIMSSYLPPDNPENANRKYLGEDISYYNFDLEKEYYKRVQEGLELFAKHFMSLWD